MLSYRHSFHAGNFADVIKHLCLVDILHYLTQKDKPLCYIDTHSGSGGYSLYSATAQKNREFENGIEKLWQAKSLPPALVNYMALAKQFNQGKKLNAYPGSPWFAQQLLRDNDRLFLCELHPSEIPLLKNHFKGDKRVFVRDEDGLAFLQGFLPTKENRALVLIDPSYEVKSEYQSVIDAVIKTHKRASTTCFAIWYPVVERQHIDRMEKTLKRSGIRNILLMELAIADDRDAGMTASGMIVINPPWQLANNMHASLEYLAARIGNGKYRLQHLVAE